MFSPAKRISLSQTFLVIAPAFILYGYNQAGLSALLDLPTRRCSLFPPNRYDQHIRSYTFRQLDRERPRQCLLTARRPGGLTILLRGGRQVGSSEEYLPGRDYLNNWTNPSVYSILAASVCCWSSHTRFWYRPVERHRPGMADREL